jgi:hypothetical protein
MTKARSTRVACQTCDIVAIVSRKHFTAQRNRGCLDRCLDPEALLWCSLNWWNWVEWIFFLFRAFVQAQENEKNIVPLRFPVTLKYWDESCLQVSPTPSISRFRTQYKKSRLHYTELPPFSNNAPRDCLQGTFAVTTNLNLLRCWPTVTVRPSSSENLDLSFLLSLSANFQTSVTWATEENSSQVCTTYKK